MTIDMPAGRSGTLSLGAELLVRRAEALVAAGAPVDCDVLIVGSGYGGAVAAARLAGQRIPVDGGGTRPASVWLVERGLEYLPGSFPDRFAELAGHVRFSMQDGAAARGGAEGLFDVRMGGDAGLLLGNGLGGGSLINAGVMARAAPGTLRSGWPAMLSPEILEAGYATALAMLQPQTLPSDLTPPKLASLQRLAGSESVQRCAVAVNHAVGHVTPAGVPMQPCTMCGDCVSGCNQGAKLTLDTNYLALAHGLGAELFTGATVERVVCTDSDQGAHWRVDWHFTEPSRRPPEGGAFTIRAGKVVLAAGSLGSTEILMRSRSAALQFSSRLGCGFSTNGDNLVAGFRQTDVVHACACEQSDPADPEARGVGPTITGMAHVAGQLGDPMTQEEASEDTDTDEDGCPAAYAAAPDDPEAAGAFTVQEFAVPAALRRVFGEVITTTFLLNGHEPAVPAPGEIAEDPLAVADAAVEHTALYGLMGDDGARGQLVFAGQTVDETRPSRRFSDGQVRVKWTALSRLPLFDRQMSWLEKASRARGGPGGVVLPSPLWRPLGQAGAMLAAGTPITVHPLGGCPMGETAATGVVNSIGQVFRPDGAIHPGLVVLDGSIVPRALAINPALTIAAVAEQACQGLLKQWGWTIDDEPLPPKAPHPSRAHAARHVVSRPYPDRGTGVVLAEHFDGPLELAGQRYWIALRLRTQAIPDLANFVRSLPRQVRLQHATLDLTPVGADHDEFSPAPRSKPVAMFTLEGEVGLFEPVATLPGREPSQSRELRYGMKVAAGKVLHPEGETAIQALPVGTSINGLKSLQSGDEVSAWIRLTQLDVRIDTPAHEPPQISTVWRLDLGRMARLRRLLLRLSHQANAPEAIADLVALALFTVRVLLVNQRLFEPDQTDMPHHLDERYPGVLDGAAPEVMTVGGTGGARLSHYAPPDDPPAQVRPVFMIHGLGASGSTFAHPSIPGNLVRHALGRGRHVWVLDLSTSIGNESASRGGRRGSPMDFETVALTDIPAALRIVHAAGKGAPIDVIAHCVGAAMFCVALLESARPAEPGASRVEASALRGLVGAVVLSQVGPLVRLSPLNQFRGFVASYVQQFLGSAEFDTRPDYKLEPDPRTGKQKWKQAKANLPLTLLDWFLTQFPYPPDDDEDARARRSGVAFRRVRHRADAIFGQLMELSNIADETLAALDAIYGWVKVSTLGQTIHYARHRMLTNASGKNASLVRQFFNSAFGFPVLLLHGQRNRVFDWRGSLDSFNLLAALRTGTPVPDASSSEEVPQRAPGVWREGEGLELRIVPGYGHQDCIIGAHAHRDVFPAIFDFLDKQAVSHFEPVSSAPEIKITAQVPWIGPVMGWLRRDEVEKTYVLSVLVHAQPRHARTLGVAVVPMRLEGGKWQPIMALARGFLAEDLASTEPPSSASVSDSAELLSPPSDLLLQHCIVLRLARHGVFFKRLAVITLHSDLPVAPEALLRERATGVGIAGEWLMHSRPLGDLAMQHVPAFFEVREADDQRVEAAMLTLSPNVYAAADAEPDAAGNAVSGQSATTSLCFALGSCQYPPGLLDTDVADASYHCLQKLLEYRAEPFASSADSRPVLCPQFLVLAGDQVYVDATAGLFDPAPSNSRDTVARAYELNWQLPAFRAVAARLPVYTLLDDHEVHDNWQPAARRTYADSPLLMSGGDQVTEALNAYETYQARIQPRPRAPRSRSYCFWPSAFPFYALDTRSERQLRRVAAQGEGEALESAMLVSPETMTHLQGWLKAQPNDLPKFVFCPSPVLPLEPFDADRNAERLRSDGWSGYPASLWGLLKFIRDNHVQRVVFLSGDVHCSLATKLVLQDGQNAIYSVVSSGLFAPWPFANARARDFVLEGEVLEFGGNGRTFGRMVTAPVPSSGGLAIVGVRRVETGPMALSVEFVSPDGKPQQCEIDLEIHNADWQAG